MKRKELKLKFSKLKKLFLQRQRERQRDTEGRDVNDDILPLNKTRCWALNWQANVKWDWILKCHLHTALFNGGKRVKMSWKETEERNENKT